LEAAFEDSVELGMPKAFAHVAWLSALDLAFSSARYGPGSMSYAKVSLMQLQLEDFHTELPLLSVLDGSVSRLVAL
jgi:hypothetical protein